jgi:hypothetical protein
VGESMALQLWFPNRETATVSVVSSVADPLEQRYFELALFALFTTRQLFNLGSGGRPLADSLERLDANRALDEAASRIGNLSVGDPGASSANIGFTATMNLGDGEVPFSMHYHGFKKRGKDLSTYYAPASVTALLYWLLARRSEDGEYHIALGVLASFIGKRKVWEMSELLPWSLKATDVAWGTQNNSRGT